MAPLYPLYLLALGAFLGLSLRQKRPSNHRDWNPDMARPPEGEVVGDTLRLHNVRNIRYGPPGSPFEAVWETRTYDLSRVRRVWFVVESFSRFEVIAHTLISFEFEGAYLAFSAEARLHGGERYNLVRGLFNAYELLYAFGDERDFILRRTLYQDHDVYLYPLDFSPQETRALLLDILAEANRLARTPRFYNSLTRNCTNLLGVHANRVRPGSFAWWRPSQVLPGLSDRLLYRKGWIDTDRPWEGLREHHNVRAVTQRLRDDPEVSERMRDGLRPGARAT
ncbi:DUF4105 domain-containing protein [Truepera radiovictrix]|uniref:Lnb N-terminal periplasmic domain-containing protein n=1 Tax=Truepera radiovictrix (strain DSM 17093 / CIP 108686 / LMG 22925 / RQ-24) TaxID=649638 RepID=D7CQI8_TRURR|nr:DUF4105 domain-containing protein [Truepera radiovictrix]ADI14972.1 conserved hypothetical protein [Truepera radiovictrix DSM 17093]WMT56473.1 DUF4105 domain-containing protein [Truepera radiovictrix]